MRSLVGLAEISRMGACTSQKWRLPSRVPGSRPLFQILGFVSWLPQRNMFDTESPVLQLGATRSAVEMVEYFKRIRGMGPLFCKTAWSMALSLFCAGIFLARSSRWEDSGLEQKWGAQKMVKSLLSSSSLSIKLTCL